MGTKLQEYKSAKAKLKAAGHKMHWSFHEWLLPKKHRREVHQHIEIPAEVTISEAPTT